MTKKAPDLGLTDEARKGVVDILNTLLADEFVLYTKTRNYHWNVVGPAFSQLHKFFEGQYEALDELIDEVAERARALGGRASGSLAEFSKATRLKEATGDVNALAMVADLLADHETVVRNLRKVLPQVDDQYGDAGTNDFLTGLVEQHEKMAWMLRAHLES